VTAKGRGVGVEVGGVWGGEDVPSQSKSVGRAGGEQALQDTHEEEEVLPEMDEVVCLCLCQCQCLCVCMCVKHSISVRACVCAK
jgi:hypothetical protein